MAVKPYYVAITFIVEMFIHLLSIAICSRPLRSNVYDLPEYFNTMGGLSIALLIMAIVALPETKKNTLRECLAKFRKFINYQF